MSNKSNSKTKFVIINCNARSLCPKIESLVECFEEMDGTVGVVSETWIRDGAEDLVERLSEGDGLGFISRKRSQPASNGVTYGGVAVLWRKSACSLKEFAFPNPLDFEVVVATGSLRGHTRKLAIISCYIPPGYSRARGEGAIEHINDIVVHLKGRFTDPYIVIAGDYNQWQVADSLDDFPDIKEAPVGPTRGDLSIDKIFTNVSRSISDSGSLEPLEDEEGEKQSDHRVAYCRADLGRINAFKWER